jgi:hypothetical protein
VILPDHGLMALSSKQTTQEIPTRRRCFPFGPVNAAAHQTAGCSKLPSNLYQPLSRYHVAELTARYTACDRRI